jgi:hypothetical protein
MNSKKSNFSKTTSSNIPDIDLENYKTPSFDQLKETAERLIREGRMPTLEQLVASIQKVRKQYLADKGKQEDSSGATP